MSLRKIHLPPRLIGKNFRRLESSKLAAASKLSTSQGFAKYALFAATKITRHANEDSDNLENLAACFACRWRDTGTTQAYNPASSEYPANSAHSDAARPPNPPDHPKNSAPPNSPRIKLALSSAHKLKTSKTDQRERPVSVSA
jgi:hypothetical protein